MEQKFGFDIACEELVEVLNKARISSSPSEVRELIEKAHQQVNDLFY